MQDPEDVSSHAHRPCNPRGKSSHFAGLEQWLTIPLLIFFSLVKVTSLWFKLFFYQCAEAGPPSVLFVKGARVKRIPPQFMVRCGALIFLVAASSPSPPSLGRSRLLYFSFFQYYEKMLLTPWEHESQVITYANCLGTLNEMLCTSPVLIQGYSEGDDSSDPEVKDVPFPFDGPGMDLGDCLDCCFFPPMFTFFFFFFSQSRVSQIHSRPCSSAYRRYLAWNPPAATSG